MLQAIKDYENNKWKAIGQKVGKPAKVYGIDSCVRLLLDVLDSLIDIRPANNSPKNKDGRCDWVQRRESNNALFTSRFRSFQQ